MHPQSLWPLTPNDDSKHVALQVSEPVTVKADDGAEVYIFPASGASVSVSGSATNQAGEHLSSSVTACAAHL